MAYNGPELPIEEVLLRPDHSLIQQSLLARRLFVPGNPLGAQFRDSAFPTNGDGFGLAWRGREGKLGQFHEITPAWDSENLRHLAEHIETGCFLAHVRAAPGGTISEQNCHPFVHDGWMFQHNGEINGFSQVKRDLTFDVAPDLYPFIRGNGDTEVCFYLALTYGLATDPEHALVEMVRRVERARAERGVTEAFRATMCASDGRRLVTLRWVSPDSDADAPSLYYTTGKHPVREGATTQAYLPESGQLVVSEPLDLHWSPHTWHEIPGGTTSVFEHGEEPIFTKIEL